jgi:hypothetical protein
VTIDPAADVVETMEVGTLLLQLIFQPIAFIRNGKPAAADRRVFCGRCKPAPRRNAGHVVQRGGQPDCRGRSPFIPAFGLAFFSKTRLRFFSKVF